ncbi:Wadjet anti-phage system protein JetD domain-containing protein [Kitasatospora sp. NPDC057198]|uniref:Wadjet anti-phage system protein JetD domain-containing protein n=1 Tax=Kitasatospora sp. NPDC057198 TaxID=3346046 RepID=UPI00362594C6
MTERSDPPQEEPGKQAAKLLEKLRARAAEAGWTGTRRTTLTAKDLLAAGREVSLPPELQRSYLRDLLMEYLEELKAHRKVIYSKSRTDKEKSPLPLEVQLMPFRSTARTVPPEPVWHSAMSWASPYWGRHYTTPPIRAAYSAMNNWFLGAPTGLALPIRERALKIFGGDPFFQQAKHPGEKVFDDLKPKPMLSDPTQLMRLINAFQVDPPLLTRAFDTVPLDEESGYHRTGPGRGLLVIENATTYWSVSHMLKHIDHGLGHVAWGIGNTFTASIGSLDRRDGISHVVYFGDLDATGLRIPLGALRRRLPWLDSIRPAVGLYDMLLRHGRPGKAMPKEARIAPAEARRITDWLAPQHRVRAEALLLRGERLAQEWVSLDHLSTETDWYADMR